MTIQPKQLALVDPSTLQIVWSNNEVRQYSVADLRNSCPCATCREKKSAPPPPPTELTVISKAETQPLRITHMEPMGRYAYAIHFSDGHDTGLFTLESLRVLGQVVQQ